MSEIPESTQKNVPINILENVSSEQIKAMIRNAIKFSQQINHLYTDNVPYKLDVKFMVTGNIVELSDLKIQKENGHKINTEIESPIDEKYNEYNALMNTPEMNRKTLGDVIKRKIMDTKMDLTRKPGKALM